MVSLSSAWSLLDAFGLFLGSFWPVLGASWCLLDPARRILDLCWSHLEFLLASWAHLGPLFVSLSSRWGLLDDSWSCPGSVLVSFRRLWALPGPLVASLGRFLGCSWDCLREISVSERDALTSLRVSLSVLSWVLVCSIGRPSSTCVLRPHEIVRGSWDSGGQDSVEQPDLNSPQELGGRSPHGKYALSGVRRSGPWMK